jgi:hypothetical protein
MPWYLEPGVTGPVHRLLRQDGSRIDPIDITDNQEANGLTAAGVGTKTDYKS